MKCKSCEVEIDKNWKHAMVINICPCCGSAIMDEALVELYKKFHSIISELLTNHEEYLNDWLRGFQYVKNTKQQFNSNKNKTVRRAEDDEMIEPHEDLEPDEKTKKLKDTVKQIKNNIRNNVNDNMLLLNPEDMESEVQIDSDAIPQSPLASALSSKLYPNDNAQKSGDQQTDSVINRLAGMKKGNQREDPYKRLEDIVEKSRSNLGRGSFNRD
jgi:hypothetical protein